MQIFEKESQFIEAPFVLECNFLKVNFKSLVLEDVIKLKRIYNKAEKDDGFRILVDRLWPRGVSKEEAKLDLWLKEIAPSSDLRKWFNHDPKKWKEFKEKYKKEVLENKQAFDKLKQVIKENKIITLLYGVKDERCSEAIVLKELLK